MIISAFCGTGKTYLCKISKKKLLELECWKYVDCGCNFPENILEDIKVNYFNKDAILISTNPIVLKKLIGIVPIVIVYPGKSLKNEYIKRFKERNSSKDFIKMLSKNWNKWLDEIKQIEGCYHIKLKQSQYISDVLPELITGDKSPEDIFERIDPMKVVLNSKTKEFEVKQ